MCYMGDWSSYIIMQSLVRGFDSFSLLAIPFFILAGEIMNTGGLSKRIVGFARSFMGHIRGSLGYAAILSSMVFAGVSGSADADTSAIGSILLPMMDEDCLLYTSSEQFADGFPNAGNSKAQRGSLGGTRRGQDRI